METKEQALEEFLKSFRIAYNFILLYSKDHKSFVKSIADLKEKAEILFSFLSPLDIVVAPQALSIDGVLYEKIALHRELAALFHLRKIESIRLSKGISTDELILLFEKLALAPKEVIRSGGLSTLLAEAGPLLHCSVVDLDYSVLLRGEGEEVRDIWSFMLRSAVDKADSSRIEEFAENFEAMLDRVKPSSILEDEELNASLKKFLAYLAKHDHAKFMECNRTFLSAVLKDKGIVDKESNLAKLKEFLVDLSEEDYAQSLWDVIVSDEHFDESGFALFAKLVDRDKHPKVASMFAEKLSRKNAGQLSPGATRKVKELFQSDDRLKISEVYRQAILSIGQGHIFEAGLVFDRVQIDKNFQYILLDLLLAEQVPQRQQLVCDSLVKVWDRVARERNIQYITCLIEVIEAKKAQGLKVLEFTRLVKRVSEFIESFVWEEKVSEGFLQLLESVTESSVGAEEYLRKIFDEGKVLPRAIAMFFALFPAQTGRFYQRLEEKHADVELVAGIIDAVKVMDSPKKLSILESIFAASNDIIKAEILKVMASLGTYNKEFIFEIIHTGSSFLKKEALTVLSDQADTQRAMEMLFIVDNPWGRNNAILLENLGLVEELQYAQAAQYVEQLSRSTPFWNFPLRRRIKEVKERLHA
ncbi:MAG: hypothetical protein PHT59_02680 [Candidatus Omnitrophica bacterium]|nr:hypothetical protein [Candidatus Omnitrophota bacterium]